MHDNYPPGYPLIDDDSIEQLSNCCSAPVDHDRMICTDCKEPCDYATPNEKQDDDDIIHDNI